MRLFKLFFKLARKYKFYYAFSVVFMVIFTLPFISLEPDSDQFEKIPINISVIDKDQSIFSEDLINYLEDYGTIVPINDNPQEKSDALFYFKTDVILTIPRNWGEAVVNKEEIPQIKKQITSDMELSYLMDNILYRYMKGIEVKRLGFDKRTTDSTIKSTLASLHQSLNTDLQVDIKQNQQTTSKVRQFGEMFTHYIGYVALMTFIKVLGGVHLSTQHKEIIKRDRMGAMNVFKRTSQLWLGSVVWAIIYWGVLMVVGGVLFGFGIFTQIQGQFYVLNALLSVLGVHALSYFIAILSKNEGVLSFLSIALSLMVAFFSGIFVPRAFIHTIGQYVVSITTPIWQVKAIEKIANITSYSWDQTQEIWIIFAIQLLIILTYFALSYIIQQRRLKHAVIK